MRFVIQRVSSASVTIDGKVRGEIGKGFVVLIGIGEDDTKEIADKLLHKLLNMRIFEDENGKTNLALKDVSGELLMISQFTLYANCKKGNRPSFTDAGRPEMAEPMYEYILEACRKEIPVVEQGEFGADMKVGFMWSCVTSNIHYYFYRILMYMYLRVLKRDKSNYDIIAEERSKGNI